MLPPFITERTVLPLIAAPMFLVSGPELVAAACRAGIVGAFPAPNARTIETLDAWLAQLSEPMANEATAPFAINIICHRSYQRRPAELELLQKYRVPIVITALGSPREVVEEVHSYGGIVLADVNSVRFAHKAAEVGVDGLVLVAAGAGGHTGQMTGFAFVDAVRLFWDGIIVLAGGISTGRGIRAAQALGADLVYMGTRFIATPESMAHADYRQMIVEASADDLILSDSFTGVPANYLKPSIRRMGIDPDALTPRTDSLDFNSPYGDAKAWKDIWSAGQGVGAITQEQSVAEVVASLQAEYAAALRRERAGDGWTRRYT